MHKRIRNKNNEAANVLATGLSLKDADIVYRNVHYFIKRIT